MRKSKLKLVAALLAGTMMISGVPQVVEPFTIVAEAASSKLSAPKQLEIALTKDSNLKLTWSKVTGADAYRVYIYDSSTDEYKTYKTVSGTKCVIKTPKSGKHYKFKVASLTKKGDSYTVQNKSDYVEYRYKATAPSCYHYDVTSRSIKFYFENNYNAECFYNLYSLNKSSGKYEYVDYAYGSTLTISGLEPNKEYKFKFSADITNKSSLSKTSDYVESQLSAKPITIKTKKASKKEFRYPTIGKDLDDAADKIGAVSFEHTGYSDADVYTERVNYDGFNGDIELVFNRKKQLVNYTIQFKMTEDQACFIRDGFIVEYGYPIAVREAKDSKDGFKRYWWNYKNGGIISQGFNSKTGIAEIYCYNEKYSL